MSDHIPFEIQTEIMKHLPVKSLIQFRCVSKQWNSFINSSDFIAGYHVSNSQPSEHLFVSYLDKQSSDRKYVSFVDDDTFPINKFSPFVPQYVSELRYGLKVIGSSNGLFLLYNVYPDNNTAVIWNPSIRKSFDIHLDMEFYSPYDIVIGFGVSPHTLDPMIVKVNFRYVFKDIKSAPRQAEVFTLSSGVWRSSLCNRLPRESIKLTNYVVDINGFLYFLAYEWIVPVAYLIRAYLIISFDLKTEEFKEVNLPSSLAYKTDCRLVLSKFRESIAVFKFNYGVDKKVDVWMIENDVQRSATKLFTINPQNATITNVFGFRKNGELLIQVETGINEYAQLFVYEPNSKQMSYLGISGRSSSFIGSSYVETLLLLNH